MDSVLLQTISKYKDDKALYLFAFLRSWHADYELIERYCSGRGTIVDVGCGYGMFANYLGMKSSARSVVGIEINKRKLALAPRGVSNVRFSEDHLERFSNQSADCIVFYGMLHHLGSFQQQEEILREAIRVLKPGGRIMVIDIDNRPLWKYWICWLVDHTLYFGDRIYFRFKNDMLKLLREKLGLHVEYFMCDSKAPLPHIAYVCSPAPLPAELVCR